MSFEVPPWALNTFPSGRRYAVSIASGTATHTRVVPAGSSTSTRVVTSNVRQASASSDGALPNPRAGSGSANSAETIVAERKKFRRSMSLHSVCRPRSHVRYRESQVHHDHDHT